jgi:hypothetical protein
MDVHVIMVMVAMMTVLVMMMVIVGPIIAVLHDSPSFDPHVAVGRHPQVLSRRCRGKRRVRESATRG